MIDNLLGPDAIPKEALITDLRALSNLSGCDLGHLADGIAAIPDESAGEAAGKNLSRALRSLETDPLVAERALRVALYVHRQWARRKLTRAQIIEDVRSLGIGDEQVANLSPLLDAMEGKLDAVRRRTGERHVLATGTPRIESATCVCDARAVFASQTYEQDQGDSQDYFVLDHFVPIVLLEIVAELNDEETTHSFLLTEEEIEQLCDVLGRARKRMATLSVALPQAETGVD